MSSGLKVAFMGAASVRWGYGLTHDFMVTLSSDPGAFGPSGREEQRMNTPRVPRMMLRFFSEKRTRFFQASGRRAGGVVAPLPPAPAGY